MLNFMLERKVRFCQFYAIEWYLFVFECIFEWVTGLTEYHIILFRFLIVY